MTKPISLLIATSLLLFACGEDPEDPAPHQDDDGPGQLIESSLERDQDPDVDAETSQQLSADNRDFAFDLLDQIGADEPGNIFFSPHSISIALAMTYAGATDSTFEQMGQTLRFELPEEQLHPTFNALDQELATRSDVDVDDGDPPVLNVVNATWGQQDYPFSDDYLDTLATHYGAGLRAMDFRNQPNEEREQINAWVEEQTEERIKDLLPEGSITPSTALVLTNAIYFLAGWDNEFDESATTDASFTRRDGTDVTVDMMSQSDYFPYVSDDTTQAISLPYVGQEMSMIAIAPADGVDLDTWEADFDAAQFDTVVDELETGYGAIALPRFKFEGDYDLKALFTAMGWTNFAQLNRMVESENRGLEITDILHKSFIDLDEEGTEAAAATAVVVGETSAPTEEFDIRFDRTFYYAIYDHPSETILFLGRVDDPSAEE